MYKGYTGRRAIEVGGLYRLLGYTGRRAIQVGELYR